MTRVILVLSLLTSVLSAQGVLIGTTPGSPDPNAILELQDSTRGFLMPRMSSAQRNAMVSPAQGLQIFNTSTQCVDVYFSGGWRSIACECVQAPAATAIPTGHTSVCPNQSGIIYSVPPVAEASSYQWSVPPGASITSGQGTNQITVTFDNMSGFVSVVAGNSCGNAAATQVSVTVSTPQVAFSPLTGAVQTPVSFSASGNYTFQWAFQGGTPSTGSGANPSSTWASTGTYAVTLWASSNPGCVDSLTQQLSIINCPAGTQSFSYTGGVQTFQVPACVSQLQVTANGAQGGDISTLPGGHGGRVTATLSVTPGSTLYIYIGGKPTTQTGGWNGGGMGIGGNGVGGGGATDIRMGGQTLNDRILVAGGGGGSCNNGGNSGGGAGGGLTGGIAANWNGWNCTNLVPAQGGTQSSGGLGGTSTSCAWNGQDGSFGQGGDSYQQYSSSGGGGGWYGGGGAHNGGGGGGGSSYVSPVAGSGITHTQGAHSGHGSLTFTW